MNIRYQLGKLLEAFHYKLAADHRWPVIECNLVSLGLNILKSQNHGPIQIVQIGAFDGLACDPLADLLCEERLAAVLVEPQEEAYRKLQDLYSANASITLVNAALTADDGKIEMWVPGDGASPKASLDPQHHKRFGLQASEMRKTMVDSISVETLMTKIPMETIHFLQIDTEGMDLAILRLFFNAGVMPPVINFESLHLTRDERIASRQVLRERGYSFIETNQDTFAIQAGLVASY